jgi:hypothetical protein
VLENDFKDYVPDVHNNIFHNKYDFSLAHFNPNKAKGIKEYDRRIERFKKIIKENKKIYFFYINEDYINNEKFRDKTFNDDIFSQMVDLDLFLKEKYENIDFVILYCILIS